MSHQTSRSQERPDQPLVLWRPPDAQGRRRGLACHVQFCSNPSCTDPHAFLTACVIDDRVDRVEAEKNGLGMRILWRLGAVDEPPVVPKVSALVDLESGKIEPEQAPPSADEEREAFRWLEEAMDGAILEELRQRRKQFHNSLPPNDPENAWRGFDWTGWDPKQPLPWWTAFPDTDDDLYILDGHSYKADDQYYIEPDGIPEALVEFWEAKDGKDDRYIGAVFVEPPACEIVGTSCAPGEHPRLLALWELYLARHGRGVLKAHSERLESVGPQILRLRKEQLERGPRRRDKVGRNDPCPCGSGRKYKKCCLGKAS